jgi:hypothetical protein
MITAPQAFVLGHAVPVIGIYFRASDLLARAAQSATAPLAARGNELLASMDGRKAGVIANVRRVEALLSALPALVGDPPKLPADYELWQQRVFDATEAALAGEPALATVHLLGRIAGDALATLNLGIYAIALADTAPGEPWLVDRLRADRIELRRLGTAIRGPAALLPSTDGRAAMIEMADDLERTDLVTVADTQTAMKRCADRLPRIEKALEPPPAGN